MKDKPQFKIGFDPYPPINEEGAGVFSIVKKDVYGDKTEVPLFAFPELINEMQKVAKFYNTPIMEEKQKAVIGVDPGKSGGIIALVGHEIVGKWIIPLSGDKVDIGALYAIFNELKAKYHITVILEEVHSIYGTSAESNFVFGFVCGAIEAIVIANHLRLNKVQPKEWQADIWQNGDKVFKPKKPEQKKAPIDTKATSLNAAKRLFPAFDFRKSDSKRVVKDHDGLIDAACLCEFGRRKNW